VLESELFGHVRGAFTGADRDRAGRIASAQGGTLLLDEVAEIPVEMQAKLLRFLQFGEMQRLGSDRIERVDVRVVAATHQDLRALVASGRFRQDLYYRLKVVELTLPALRERSGDIPLLVDEFIKRFSRGKVAPRFTPRAMARLQAHDWPGNVRELMHVVEHACVVGRGTDLDIDALPQELAETRVSTRPPVNGSSRPPKTSAPTTEARRFTSDELDKIREGAVASAEREFLQELFDRFDGNVSRAARESGIHRSYLQRLMARHSIRKSRPGD
jgi:Nif-specific regulatory protein/two-component system response regulator HydG